MYSAGAEQPARNLFHHSSRDLDPKYSLDDPVRRWCPEGEVGRDDERPLDLRGLSGSFFGTPFCRPCPVSIVVFSYSCILIGGPLNLASGSLLYM